MATSLSSLVQSHHTNFWKHPTRFCSWKPANTAHQTLSSLCHCPCLPRVLLNLNLLFVPQYIILSNVDDWFAHNLRVFWLMIWRKLYLWLFLNNCRNVKRTRLLWNSIIKNSSTCSIRSSLLFSYLDRLGMTTCYQSRDCYCSRGCDHMLSIAWLLLLEGVWSGIHY